MAKQIINRQPVWGLGRRRLVVVLGTEAVTLGSFLLFLLDQGLQGYIVSRSSTFSEARLPHRCCRVETVEASRSSTGVKVASLGNCLLKSGLS